MITFIYRTDGADDGGYRWAVTPIIPPTTGSCHPITACLSHVYMHVDVHNGIRGLTVTFCPPCCVYPCVYIMMHAAARRLADRHLLRQWGRNAKKE